jgi:hypothetical protein
VKKVDMIEYLKENMASEEWKLASPEDRADIMYHLFIDCVFNGELELPDTELEDTDDNLEVDDLVENEDGSAQMTIRMNHDTLVFYAQIGLLKTLEDAARRTLNEQDL